MIAKRSHFEALAILLVLLTGCSLNNPDGSPTPPMPAQMVLALAIPTSTHAPTIPAPTATKIAPSATIPPPTQTPVPLTPTPTSPALGHTLTRPSDSMIMAYVPGGIYKMGSTDDEVSFAVQICNKFVQKCRWEWFSDQQPGHTVTLDSFWIDRTEVTNAQYTQCVSTGACNPPWSARSFTRTSYYEDSAFADYPVMYTTWVDAEAYCSWAGAHLPTEAEWEYAARGPERWWYPWGDEFDGTQLNYCDHNCPITDWKDNRFDYGYADTAPVGSFPSGESWCGALDMAGNVWGWVADWYGEYPADHQLNPAGPVDGDVKVLRGGSWDHEPCEPLSAYRTWFHPSSTYSEWNVCPGFRCTQDTE